MSSGQIFWLCLFVIGAGGALVWAIVRFGYRIFDVDQNNSCDHVRCLKRLCAIESNRQNLPRYLVDALTESLQSRNEFWVTYGQILVSVLIIVTLTVLLLTKTISAEAGLPLLSAVSGFAIAKGGNLNRSNSPAPDREQG